MAERIKQFVEHPSFMHAITGLILLAAILVGLETEHAIVERYGAWLTALDWLVLIAFTIEAGLKMAQHGRHWRRYFHDPWNLFDFTIVVVCWLPINGQYAAVLRLARILRTLRLITTVPQMQLLVASLIRTIPSMGYVGLLLFMLFYVYAVIGVMLWGENDPGHFGDLPAAMLTLFRVVTLEDWTDVMYTQMFGAAAYAPQLDAPTEFTEAHVGRPVLAACYFVSFVLIGTMVVLNLFIGVIVNSMDEAQAELAADLAARAKAKAASGGEEGAAAVDLTTEFDEMARELESLGQRLRVLREQARVQADRANP